MKKLLLFATCIALIAPPAVADMLSGESFFSPSPLHTWKPWNIYHKSVYAPLSSPPKQQDDKPVQREDEKTDGRKHSHDRPPTDKKPEQSAN